VTVSYLRSCTDFCMFKDLNCDNINSFNDVSRLLSRAHAFNMDLILLCLSVGKCSILYVLLLPANTTVLISGFP
jgi:hypothetical protein